MRRVVSTLRGLAAAAAMAALVVGVPVGLARAVGWPLPRTLPSWRDVADAFAYRGVDGNVVVAGLAVVMWVLWAQLAAAVAVEIRAAARGTLARHLPVAPGVQAVAARLVAAVVLASSLAASRPAAANPPVDLRVVVTPTPPALKLTPTVLPVQEAAGPASAVWKVARHDSYWAIAEQTLGDGFAWQRIRDANLGRTMPDGFLITASSTVIRPGWELLLPADATPPPTEANPAAELRSELAATSEVVRVQGGDSLWSIAERAAAADGATTPGAVHRRWQELIDANRSRLADPAVIYTDQELILPNNPATEQRERSPEPSSHQAPSAPDAPADAPPDVAALPAPPPAAAAAADRPNTAPETPAASTPEDGHGDGDERVEVPAAAAGVAGGVALAGVAAVIARRRRRRQALAPAGHLVAPRPPAPVVDELDRRADVPTAERLAAGMATAAAHAAALGLATRPRVVQMTAEGIEMFLTEPSTRPPGGWTAESGGAIWRTPPSLTATAPEAPAAPLLVTLGVDGAATIAIDLEADGVIAVTGVAGDVRGFVRSALVEIAYSGGLVPPTVLVVGDLGALAPPEQAITIPSWGDATDDVDAAVGQRSTGPHIPVFAARSLDPDAETLAPLVVVLDADPGDERFAALLAASRDPDRAVAVVCVGFCPPDATEITVAGGTAAIAALGLRCDAQLLARDAAADLAGALDLSPPRDDEIITIDRAPAVPPSLVDALAGLDVVVRVLGEVRVDGALQELTPQQVALLAYIALHQPVAGERIQEAIWSTTPSRAKRLANTLSKCRTAVGPKLLPAAADGRYHLHERAASDLAVFESLVARAENAETDEAIELLRQAVSLVDGPVFSYRSAGRAAFAWVDHESWIAVAELKITEAVLRLLDLASASGALDTALWAAEQGLRAMPIDSDLVEAAIALYDQAGDPASVQRVFHAHASRLADLELEVADSTIELYQRLSRRATA